MFFWPSSFFSAIQFSIYSAVWIRPTGQVPKEDKRVKKASFKLLGVDSTGSWLTKADRHSKAGWLSKGNIKFCFFWLQKWQINQKLTLKDEKLYQFLLFHNFSSFFALQRKYNAKEAEKSIFGLVWTHPQLK